jgi:F-box and WD-40 domain protein 1/11
LFAEFAYAILRSLRTSSIAGIVERLNPLLHIDPVLCLPPEVTFEIFSYLDPQALLIASTLSKSWRGRTLDSRLWRQLFSGEGWAANSKYVRAVEEERRTLLWRSAERKSRIRSSEDVEDAERKSPKKRVRERQLFGEGSAPLMHTPGTHSPLQWAAQHGPVETDEDANMEDAPVKIEADMDADTPLPSPTPLDLSSNTESLDPPIQSSLILNHRTNPTINWQHLFKQKRRLEANWIAGKYRNFQLPHPSHPKEAHAECVYTIQYSASHLVSGSRDKTLRVWNLDTQRLLLPPLRGHSASVLCLQFDDRPDQDIIVSGGSDCHVIIWRFSTGKIIRKLEHAHQESVLNLRFDDRYLITCSKDKTIKVWNRHALLPSDDAYPNRGVASSARFPAYIVNIDNLLETDLANMKPLREHSLLMTLEGHGAAVNAIQILGSQIVSASGDRHVKIWDVKTGLCLKTISGHAKGIACVQFDGRRIVSGSSDETVRIFDRVTGAEVACLKGHNNLVRTVQARFGDVPGSEEAEEQEARDIDRKYLSARLGGTLSTTPMTREQRRVRNAGGRDPKDIFAVGAKLPPGGGGSKWARIVSGSYDETVIIWKRGADGKWTPAHQLLQWEAVLRAGGQPRFTPLQLQHPGHVHHGVGTPQTALAQQQQMHAMMAGVPPHMTFQQWFAQFGNSLSQQQLQQLHAQWVHQLNQLNQMQNQASQLAATASTATTAGAASTQTTTTATASSSSTPNTQTSANQQQASQPLTQPQQQVLLQQLQNLPGPAANTTVPVPNIPAQWLNNLPHHPAGTGSVQAAQANAALTNAAIQANQQHINQIPAQAAAAQAAHHAHGQGAHPVPAGAHLPVGNPAHGLAGNHALAALAAANVGTNNGTNSRVFKLQFDSRRIICCSQDPTIVGWDFADGDQEIEDASRFFGEDC